MSVLTIKCSCGSSYEIPCACASETPVTPPSPQEQAITLANRFKETYNNKMQFVPYSMDKFIKWLQTEEISVEQPLPVHVSSEQRMREFLESLPKQDHPILFNDDREPEEGK